VLISRVPQNDSHALEFAHRSAGSAVPTAGGGRDFADYLSATLSPRAHERSTSDHTERSYGNGGIDTPYATARKPRYPSDERPASPSDRSGRSAAERSDDEEAGKSKERLHGGAAAGGDTAREASERTDATKGADAKAGAGTSEDQAGKTKTADEDGASTSAGESSSDGTGVGRAASKEGVAHAAGGSGATDRNAGEAGASADASGGVKKSGDSVDERDTRAHAAKRGNDAEKAIREAGLRAGSGGEPEEAGAADAAPRDVRAKGDAASGRSGATAEAGEREIGDGTTAAHDGRTSAAAWNGASDTRAGEAAAANGRTGGREAGRTDAAEERHDRAVRHIEVRDVRQRRAGSDASSGNAGGDSSRGRGGGSEAANVGPTAHESASQTDFGSDRGTASAFEALRSDAISTNGASGRGTLAAARDMADAADGLRQALRDGVNAEIVRSARLIVRGNDSGEIRLHLKPEQLGSVRIALQMQDGHIAGRIIVENQSVRDAFEQNLAALQRAFQESGLEAGGLEVSVADSGDQSGETADRSAHGGRRRGALAALDGAVPEADWIDDDHDLVDMVV
jgi:flagellar hook-length control protein FliK